MSIQLEDERESVDIIEPLKIGDTSRHRTRLTDLALELMSRSVGFRRSLPTGVAVALAELVRSMNCYYSNLIEGHHTHPVDIERALNDDFSSDPEKRNLQLEARAHISVQKWIDDGGLTGRALTTASILEIHRRFCEELPADLLDVTDPKNGETLRMQAGALRTRFVAVGRHKAISPGAVPRFMARFESAYQDLGRTDAILAAAAAHHRILWIHPFLDGNGRVARLMSYAILKEYVHTDALWSVARGLARREPEYKKHLENCDAVRAGDLDGRGALSESALADFTEFFLKTCIDQVDFMERLAAPSKLRDHMVAWAKATLQPETTAIAAARLIEEVFTMGEITRPDAMRILGKGDRHARRVTQELTKWGVLNAEHHKAPFKLAFPAKLAPHWMPGLFPPDTNDN